MKTHYSFLGFPGCRGIFGPVPPPLWIRAPFGGLFSCYSFLIYHNLVELSNKTNWVPLRRSRSVHPRHCGFLCRGSRVVRPYVCHCEGHGLCNRMFVIARRSRTTAWRSPSQWGDCHAPLRCARNDKFSVINGAICATVPATGAGMSGKERPPRQNKNYNSLALVLIFSTTAAINSSTGRSFWREPSRLRSARVPALIS